tara:strand:- start:893 stop:1825 length:933 start_codon:yes stop_codon:yes gene_type:complete
MKKNTNKIITVGIITVPLSPGRKYYQVCGDSYISTAHSEWLKSAGLSILAIPYTTKDFQWYFERINGLYLPSGGVFASNSREYYNCCKEFMKLAIDANDNGNYFPVWGGCMGFQQMLIMADGKDNLENFLERFDSFGNLELPLIFTDEGVNGKMMAKAKKENPDYIIKLMSENCTLNNHMMGISPEKFNRSKLLRNFYNIVSYNYDRKGNKFVSTIEAKEYPFYGVQWHPERDIINMQYFSEFFASEVFKNKHTTLIPQSRRLQKKKINCMTYSGNIYKNCYFYWHQRTSIHNKKLCSVLNLGDPVDNRI